MKRLINTTSIICFLLLAAFIMASCDTTNTEATETITTEDYPTVTITSDFQGSTVAEGQTITYTITTDKPFPNPIDFEMAISKDEEDNVIYKPVTFPAFSEEPVTFTVTFPNDNIPEKEPETVSYTIKDETDGTKYSLNPNSKFVSEQLTIENTNNPNGLTVALDWENPEDDIDMYATAYAGGTTYLGFLAGASLDKPEIIVDGTGIEGVFYYLIVPFTYHQPVVNYTFKIGYPDQSVEFIEGSYTVGDFSRADPNFPISAQRFLKVTSTLNANGEMEFTVENLDPVTESSFVAGERVFNKKGLKWFNSRKVIKAGELKHEFLPKYR